MNRHQQGHHGRSSTILSILAKVLARRNNAMWDILLQIEDVAKALDGSILTTKPVRLETECMDTRKTKVTLHKVPLCISEDHLGLFFAKSGAVADLSAVKSKAGFATGDVETTITVDRKIFHGLNQHAVMWWPSYLCCSGRTLTSQLVLWDRWSSFKSLSWEQVGTTTPTNHFQGKKEASKCRREWTIVMKNGEKAATPPHH